MSPASRDGHPSPPDRADPDGTAPEGPLGTSAPMAATELRLQLPSASSDRPHLPTQHLLHAPSLEISSVTSPPSVVVPLPASLSSADQAAVRASLDSLSSLLSRLDAHTALEGAYADLDQTCVELQSRVRDLERELQNVYAAASPFVQHVQEKFELLRAEHETTVLALADCRKALADRHDNRQELDAVRTQLAAERASNDEMATAFHRQIGLLERRIGDLRARRGTQPTGSARRLARRVALQQQELAVMTTSRDRAVSTLRRLQVDLQTSETNRQVLDTSLMRLQQRVRDLENQVADLRSQADRQTAELRLQQTRSDEERDRLRAQVADSASQLQQGRTELRHLTGERDRAASALLSARSQVTSARAAVSRLEQQVASMQPDRRLVGTLQRENVRLIHDLASTEAVRVQLEGERDQLRQDRDDIRNRVEGLVSVVCPGHSGSSRTASVSRQHSSSQSPSSHRSGRTERRRRSSSSESSSRPARSRRRLHRSTSNTRSVTSASSSAPGRRQPRPSASPRRSASPAASIASTRIGRLRGGSRSRSVASQPPSSASSDHESLRAALSRSRSSGRRGGQSSGSPNRPISVDSSESSGSRSPRRGWSSPDSPGRDNGGGSPGGSGNSHGGHNSSSGSDGSVPRRILTPRNVILDRAAYDLLSPTTVPRGQWIPGYRERVRRASSDVRPWDPRYIRRTCILELDIELLFHHFSKPREWLFPARQPVPARVDWGVHLITEANIRALYDSRPWTALSVVVNPISFETGGWFQPLTTQYRELEADCLQTLWESTHSFPIIPVMRRSSPFMNELWTDRKQRQSRFGARWKSWLKNVLRGIVAGHCDLDILLDPIFLHRPRMGERKAWYPGLGTSPRPRDLIAAARAADLVEPWRLQYRAHLPAHPAMQIARLTRKFMPLANH